MVYVVRNYTGECIVNDDTLVKKVFCVKTCGFSVVFCEEVVISRFWKETLVFSTLTVRNKDLTKGFATLHVSFVYLDMFAVFCSREKKIKLVIKQFYINFNRRVPVRQTFHNIKSNSKWIKQIVLFFKKWRHVSCGKLLWYKIISLNNICVCLLSLSVVHANFSTYKYPIFPSIVWKWGCLCAQWGSGNETKWQQ